MEKRKVLFICRDNSVRSQVAAAFLNTYFGDRYKAYSAGIEPLEVNPRMIMAMKEIGIDISSCQPKSIKELQGDKFDCIITLCDYAKTLCFNLPEHKKLLHKSFKDYCIPVFCENAGKNELCFPEPAKRQRQGLSLPDSAASKEEILNAFRNLREEVFEWVEKEAVF